MSETQDLELDQLQPLLKPIVHLLLLQANEELGLSSRMTRSKQRPKFFVRER